jgi:murein DD-endopeptidase MepM/ murein hydrolase activator NlpD
MLRFGKQLFFIGLLALSSCVQSSKRQIQPPKFAMMTAWVSPVDASVTLTQKFRPPKNQRHKGVDLAGRMNQPLFAVNNGVVTYRGEKFRGYGKMVLIDHGNGWTTLYSHLNKYNVRDGEQVKTGQTIGFMGKSGRASGVHIHFEIYKNKIPIDPLLVIPIKYKVRR